MSGLQAAWSGEIAFRIHCLLAAFFIPASFFVARSAVELSLLLLTCGLVLIAELFNSAIESVVDRVSTERHRLSGRAKDLGSAGVFASLMTFLAGWIPIVWVQVFP